MLISLLPVFFFIQKKVLPVIFKVTRKMSFSAIFYWKFIFNVKWSDESYAGNVSIEVIILNLVINENLIYLIFVLFVYWKYKKLYLYFN